MEKIWEYTIKLLRYVLNGDIPQLPEDIDFEQLFAFGESHGVENMLYVGLRDLKINVPPDTMAKFEEAHDMAIMIEAMQALELEAIGEAFGQAGIAYIPLKGSVVKYFYPMPDYRKSGDIDILIRTEDEGKAEKILFSMDYKKKTYEKEYDVHAEYAKSPFMLVELHRQLVKISERTYDFCKEVWIYAENDVGYRYKMSDEYMYVYLLAHLCHHLYQGGAGIRLIMDIYVVRDKLQLDNNQLDKYLAKAKLTELNKMVCNLTDKWFGDSRILDKDTDVLENIVLTGGSFGTQEIKEMMLNSDTGVNKLGWLIRKIFSPVYSIRRRYAVVEKVPYLLPFFWIIRLFDILIFDRNVIIENTDKKFDTSKQNKDIKNIVKAIRHN